MKPPFQRALAAALFSPPPGARPVDFTAPAGASALAAPDSVTWRVMKNPLTMFIGGVAAVILELAEPRVRTGVWDFTQFKTDPMGRMRRTGYAAMVTAYAPAEAARAMIAGINRMHGAIEARTPAGAHFRADDPELLVWVAATATFGFLEAYRAYGGPISARDADRFYEEARVAAALYGADAAPASTRACENLFSAMRPKLEPSPIVADFLAIVRAAPILPAPLRPLQNLAISAAIGVVPAWAQELLGLDARLAPGANSLLRALGAAADRVVLEYAPPAQACMRMGLAPAWLYRRARV